MFAQLNISGLPYATMVAALRDAGLDVTAALPGTPLANTVVRYEGVKVAHFMMMRRGLSLRVDATLAQSVLFRIMHCMGVHEKAHKQAVDGIR